MTLKLYVDGSWKKHKPNVSGWAYVILDDKNRIIEEENGTITSKSRQIDGELEATLQGIEALTKYRDHNKIYLYYDYLGIEKWAKGSWKAKSDVAVSYVKELSNYPEILEKITFVKVKSHSKMDTWNDYVDMLAKKAVDQEGMLD